MCKICMQSIHLWRLCIYLNKVTSHNNLDSFSSPPPFSSLSVSLSHSFFPLPFLFFYSLSSFLSLESIFEAHKKMTLIHLFFLLMVLLKTNLLICQFEYHFQPLQIFRMTCAMPKVFYSSYFLRCCFIVTIGLLLG